MRLSIIIVNYNVRFFLEHCLLSLRKATRDLAAEVIVVDNLSTDGSLPYLIPRFPEVRFIDWQQNAGFAKACNRGMQDATGDYILFLNPDTLIPEDCLVKCLQFFQEHPDCGGLGVPMIDGSGSFLKESKRAFPSPLTSFFKLTGLASVFPRSRVFGKYHLGHLDKHHTHRVDVLAGAFLMSSRKVLMELGGFDESFFMYGEDVDLSYRIQKAGYVNYYFPGTTIIHFKGESTKRGSLNYVRMFYGAMNIFVEKHYGGAKAGLFRFFIKLAIQARAALAALSKLFRGVGLPLLDAILIFTSFWVVKNIWAGNVRPDINYPDALIRISLPAFTIIFLLVAYYAGLYDRHYRRGDLLRATGTATLMLLVIYSLLPEYLRFSRGIVVFGALLALILIAACRALFLKLGWLRQPSDQLEKPFMLLAATSGDATKARRLLAEQGLEDKIIAELGPTQLSETNKSVRELDADELLFCTEGLGYGSVIETILSLKTPVRLRFFDGNTIIGSDTRNTRGEIIHGTQYALAAPAALRLKRLIDVILAVLFLLISPLLIWLQSSPGNFMRNIFQVISGNKTWVGYFSREPGLPKLRDGVLSPTGSPLSGSQQNAASQLDEWYAREYRIIRDLRVIFASIRRLG